MKAVSIFVTAFLILVISACNKKKYPDSVVVNQSVFYLNATINNAPVSIGAGVSNYYMYSSYKQDSDLVYNFTGALKELNCTGACANSALIWINDLKTSAASAPINPDSSFRITPRSYASNSPGGFQAQFQATYNRIAASYLWDFGDGGTSNQPNPVHLYTKAGSYNVCLTINGTNSCIGSICNVQKIGLAGNPCQTSISLVSDSGSAVSLSQVSSGQAPFTYLWDFGDGGTSTSSTPAPHVYAVRGAYPVSLRVIDANNSESKASYNVVTEFDGSSCAANYKVVNVTPVSPAYFNLSTVGFSWTDASGTVYSSAGIQQPSSSYFNILSVEDYQSNESGQKTKKMHVKFKCVVTNGSQSLTVDNAEAVISVAYH